MKPWHTTSTAQDVWSDAPYDEDDLAELLEVARQQVLAYAPRSARTLYAAPAAAVPPNLRRAQLEQAKNIWAAGATDATGGIGDGEAFVIRPHPLDWSIKQMIRPKGGVPRAR